MPKMKTPRGADKRIKVTGTGKIVKNSSNSRHKLGKKSSKRKRKLRIAMVASKPDAKRVQELLPYK